jgi:hypothetical protein
LTTSRNHGTLRRMRMRIALGTAAVVCALLLPVARAAAVTFGPVGDKMHLTVANAQWVWGTTSIVCETGGGSGKVSNPASETISLTGFSFHNAGGEKCGTTGMEGAKFEAVASPETQFLLTALSTTTARFQFPGTEFFQLVDGKCVLPMKGDWMSGAWKNGAVKSPAAVPSTLTVSNTTVFARSGIEKSTEENCPSQLVTNMKAKTEGKFSATFTAFDDSLPIAPITIK